MGLHKAWIESAVAKGLARFEDATVTVRNVGGIAEKEVPFQRVVFTLGPDSVQDLWSLAETARKTVKDDAGNEAPSEHPVNTLLTYAYGLNCRALVRAGYEAQFVDPEAAIKKIANALVKSGRFKSFEKALSAARLLQEED